MKNYALLFLSLSFAALACHTKKSTTSNGQAKAATPAPAVAPKENSTQESIVAQPEDRAPFQSAAPLTDAQMEAVKMRYNDISEGELEKGVAIWYKGACINCHKPKEVAGFSEKVIDEVMEDMCKKAKLSPADAQAVTRYAFARTR